MFRLRKTSRRPCRTVIARHWRPLNRSHVRPLGGFERGPDPLTQALGSYRHAIRAYRRLAKLAPSRFDAAVVNRERQFREEQRRWMASCEPALEKAYGPLTPEQREAQRQAELLAEQPRPLHPRTQRAVNREWSDFLFWKAAAKLSMARYEEYKQRRPHDLPSLVKLAQLLAIAFDLKWIATGFDWRKPKPPSSDLPPPQPDWEADLRRAYGTPHANVDEMRSAYARAAAQCGSPDQRAATKQTAPSSLQSSTTPSLYSSPDERTPSQPSATSPLPTPPKAVPPPPAAPVPATHHRRDAWASLARHQRQLSRR